MADNFIETVKELRDQKSGPCYDRFQNTLNYLEKFNMGEPNIKKAEAFKKFLLKNVKQNSANHYFITFMEAVRAHGLYLNVKGIPKEQTKREFLTMEELRALRDTPCSNPEIKKAFLFSALTGKRWSEVKELTWDQVRYSSDIGYYLDYQNIKGKRNHVHPISDSAFELLGERGHNRVFKLTYSNYQNKKLKAWIKEAGIEKDITFHCARHTYATLQLVYGVDLKTVSDMLDHKSIRTTEIYAKVMTETKIKAASKMQL